MNATKTTGLALAIAAAGLMASTTANAYGSKKPEFKSDSAEVHCYGVTSCAGHNDCKTAENACKGQAVCKGHGFLVMSEKECTDAGGTVGK